MQPTQTASGLHGLRSRKAAAPELGHNLSDLFGVYKW